MVGLRVSEPFNYSPSVVGIPHRTEVLFQRIRSFFLMYAEDIARSADLGGADYRYALLNVCGEQETEFTMGYMSALAHFSTDLYPGDPSGYFCQLAVLIRTGNIRAAQKAICDMQSMPLSAVQRSRLKANESTLWEMQGDLGNAFKSSIDALQFSVVSPLAISNYSLYRTLMEGRQ